MGSNLLDTVKRFKTGTYTVTHRSINPNVNGRAVPPTLSNSLVDACIQPASGRDLQRLPDGMRNRETIKVWCGLELKVASSTHEPDLIAYKNKTYEVQNVEPWDDLGAYFKALAVKVGD